MKIVPWQKREIAWETWMTFLGAALISFIASAFDSVHTAEVRLMRHFMNDANGMSDLLFAAIPPIIIAIIFGATLTFWKARHPSSR